jgi:hypothetical protein
MYRRSMPVKLERNVCLPLTASKDLQVDLRTDYKFRPLLERRARLDFTFLPVLAIQGRSSLAPCPTRRLSAASPL